MKKIGVWDTGVDYAILTIRRCEMVECRWEWDGEEWETGCGLSVLQGSLGPEYLEWVYCPYCGHVIWVVDPEGG